MAAKYWLSSLEERGYDTEDQNEIREHLHRSQDVVILGESAIFTIDDELNV